MVNAPLHSIPWTAVEPPSRKRRPRDTCEPPLLSVTSLREGPQERGAGRSRPVPGYVKPVSPSSSQGGARPVQSLGHPTGPQNMKFRPEEKRLTQLRCPWGAFTVWNPAKDTALAHAPRHRAAAPRPEEMGSLRRWPESRGLLRGLLSGPVLRPGMFPHRPADSLLQACSRGASACYHGLRLSL